MRVFRILLAAIILSGATVFPVRAGDLSQSGSGNDLYFPIVFRQIPATGWIGPDGGSVIGLVVDPTNSNIVYAGTFGAGVFKSTDGGQSWTAANNGLDNPKIQTLAIDPSNPSTLYTGTYRDETLSGHEGIYKSTDAGLSWTRTSSGLQSYVVVYSIAIDPTNPNRLYAATRGRSNNGEAPWNGKVYRSTDGGASWTNVPSMENIGGYQDWVYEITVYPGDTRQVYAASHENGPFVSSDYGVTWVQKKQGIPAADLNGRSIVVNPSSGSSPTVYFGDWKTTPGVYRSVDGGAHWISVRIGLDLATVYGLTINPASPAQLYTATFTHGVYKTLDNGDNWFQSGLPMNKTWIVAISASHPDTLYTGTFGDGVYRSADAGASWAHAQAGIRNAWITSLVSLPGSPVDLFASLNGGGIYHSPDGGQTWLDFSSNLPDRYINSLAVNSAGTILYAMTDSHGLYRAPLSTGSWTASAANLPHTLETDPLYPDSHPLADPESQEVSSGDGTPQVDGYVLSPAPSTVPLVQLVAAPSNPQVMYLSTKGAGVYRSTDGGTNWAAAGLAGGTIWSLAVHPQNADQVYAAATTTGVIKVTANAGASWEDLAIPGRLVYCLMMPASPTPVLFAGTDNGVYVYNGSGWVMKGLAGSSISTLTADSANPAHIAAGTTSGAFYSVNNGDTWTIGPSELSGLTVPSIEIIPGSSQVYYGSTTRGVYLGLLP